MKSRSTILNLFLCLTPIQLLDVISNPRLIVPNEVLTFCENLKDKINRKRDELQADEDFRTGQHLKKSGMIESALSRFSKAAHLGHVQAFVEVCLIEGVCLNFLSDN